MADKVSGTGGKRDRRHRRGRTGQPHPGCRRGSGGAVRLQQDHPGRRRPGGRGGQGHALPALEHPRGAVRRGAAPGADPALAQLPGPHRAEKGPLTLHALFKQAALGLLAAPPGAGGLHPRRGGGRQPAPAGAARTTRSRRSCSTCCWTSWAGPTWCGATSPPGPGVPGERDLSRVLRHGLLGARPGGDERRAGRRPHGGHRGGGAAPGRTVRRPGRRRKRRRTC